MLNIRSTSTYCILHIHNPISQLFIHDRSISCNFSHLTKMSHLGSDIRYISAMFHNRPSSQKYLVSSMLRKTSVSRKR